MSVKTRYPKGRTIWPRPFLKRSLTEFPVAARIELTDPELAVGFVTASHNDEPERRSISLSVDQANMSIEFPLHDVDALIEDLEAAKVFLAGLDATDA